MKMKSGTTTFENESDTLTTRSTCVFRGIEYVISACTTNNGRSLVVEVEDKLTADQWRGKFDSSYIEDLTRKTGNFKQFPVFVSMLESALEKNSDSVVLDLLTYSDLELLRNRKVGKSAKPLPNAQALVQQNKRYLILIYSVEFDRIHYPLPLPYQGKPDPVHLQNMVRQLNDEIRKLKTAQIGLQDEDYEQLKEEYETVLQEKNQLEIELEQLKAQVMSGTEVTVSKEVRILKKVVQNLELEMVKEKNRYQRQLSKKTSEVKTLTNELEELTSRERTLRIRVKSLTNELAMYKRTRTPVGSGRPSTGNSGSRSAQRRAPRPSTSSMSDRRSFDRSGSRLRSQSRSQSRDRSRPPSIRRDRSASADRQSLSRSANKSRTPTPRFNPTSYIEEKRRRERETQERRKRRISTGYTPGSGDSLRGRARARADAAFARRSGSRERGGYMGRMRSRDSSVESRQSSDGSVTRTRQRRHMVAWEDSPSANISKPLRRRSSTPDPDRYKDAERPTRIPAQRVPAEYDVNMAEIDARLNALQQYMQELGAAK